MKAAFEAENEACIERLIERLEAALPPGQARSDLLCTLCELLRNAREHGGAAHFSLKVESTPRHYRAALRQHPPPARWRPGPRRFPRGHGLPMIRALAEQLRFEGPETRFSIPKRRSTP